jgi:DNA-binding response OmpR family regulator
MQVKAQIPGRILVVDDELAVCELLERVLTRAGHSVDVVQTAEAALQKLCSIEYDLLVVDKNLPDINGIELVKKVRINQPGLLALVITAYPTPESEKEALQLGVVGYVVKPFGILEMVKDCDAAIRAARASVGKPVD